MNHKWWCETNVIALLSQYVKANVEIVFEVFGNNVIELLLQYTKTNVEIVSKVFGNQCVWVAFANMRKSM